MSNICYFPPRKKPFAVGDVVTLKSGGFACLVLETDELETRYGWFDVNGQARTARALNVCLKLLLAAPTFDGEIWSNC